MFNLPSLSTASSSNCLSCSLYLTCKDPMKSILYKCSRYKETPASKDSQFFMLQDFGVQDKAETPSKQVQRASDTRPSNRYDLLRKELGIEDDESFSIFLTIEKALSKRDSIVSPDLRIDDSDFRLARNFFDFCTSKDYLGESPYLEQALMGIQVFAEWCPRCSNKRWMQNHAVDEPLDNLKRNVRLLVRGVCPKCKVTKSELVLRRELNYYQECAICAGQRSGKSAWMGMVSAYLTHWLIMLQNPNELYGLMASNVLHGTFVALTYAQAKNTLWEPYYGYLQDSPFFHSYHKMLDYYQTKSGEELYRLKDTFVSYRFRRIFIQPSGPDRRTLRGLTRCLASIDELGLFDNAANTAKVKINASEVYKSLGNSLVTVRASANNLMRRGFNTVPHGYFLNISSPYSARDRMMQLVRLSQGSSKIYGLIKATWEMNPTITRDDLSEQFRDDPIGAMRDFGAQPPLTSNPFISSISLLEACLTKRPNPCSIKYAVDTRTDGTTTTFAYFTSLKPSGKPSILAIDAGFSNNSFACAVGHLKDESIPMIDLLVEIQPTPGCPINYTLVYNHIICKLVEERNVVLVLADRWNSLKILSDLALEFEISAKQLSLKYSHFGVFKGYLEDAELLLPKAEEPLADITKHREDYPGCFKHSPVTHLLLQALTVQDTKTSIIKGENLTDDLFRAMVLAVTGLVDPINNDLFTQPDEEETVSSINIQQSMALRRGSGSGSSRMSGDNGKLLGFMSSRSNKR